MPSSSVSFGPFDANLSAGELRKSGVRIKLEQQPFQVLALLLSKPGEIVTREELKEALWAGDTFVDFDNGLNTAILKIRRALDDSATTPRYVETLPKRGYRFIGPVEAPAASGTARPRTRPEKRLIWTLAGAGALAAALGISALISLWPGAGGEPERTATVYQEMPLTSYPGTERAPTFSPDGSQVVFSWNGPNEDNFDIYVQVVGSANLVRITSDPAEDYAPSWSPDGRLITFARIIEGHRVLCVVPPLGGQERRILDAESASQLPGRLYGRPVWFPDGKSLAVSVRPDPGKTLRIMQVPVESGTPEVLVSPEREESDSLGSGDSHPAFSPDGKTLAWLRRGDRRTLLTKKLGEADALEVAEVDFGFPVRDVVWSPDGGRLLFTTGGTVQGGATSRLFQIPVGGGSPEPIPGVSAGANEPAVSRAGNRLAYARVYQDSNIWRVDLDPGGGERQRRKLAPSTRAETVPRISPSGEQVVFVSNRAGEHRQTWVCNSDGANLRQITSFADRPAGSPRWSPDGRMIAFDSNVEGNWQTFVVNADGGQARQLTSGNYFNSRPAWSRDGKSLYFYSTRDGGLAIWKMPLAGGEAVRLADAPANDPFESSDGQWIYFERKNRLWKVPAGGGTEEIASEEIDLSEQAWSFDERGNIYWVERDEESGQWAVRKLNPRGEISDVAFMDRPPQSRAGLDVAPEGTWFVYAQDDQSQSDLMLIENFR